MTFQLYLVEREKRLRNSINKANAAYDKAHNLLGSSFIATFETEEGDIRTILLFDKSITLAIKQTKLITNSNWKFVSCEESSKFYYNPKTKQYIRKSKQ